MTSLAASATAARIERLSRTVDDLSEAIHDQSEATLARRPTAAAWSATEIVCHLRDVEEAYLERVHIILANTEPVLPVLDPERWVEERQYRRHDITLALEAFRTRRTETLQLLRGLTDEHLERGGRHALRGWMTIRRIVHGTARHDEEHLDQLQRALAGLA